MQTNVLLSSLLQLCHQLLSQPLSHQIPHPEHPLKKKYNSYCEPFLFYPPNCLSSLPWSAQRQLRHLLRAAELFSQYPIPIRAPLQLYIELRQPEPDYRIFLMVAQDTPEPPFPVPGDDGIVSQKSRTLQESGLGGRVGWPRSLGGGLRNFIISVIPKKWYSARWQSE